MITSKINSGMPLISIGMPVYNGERFIRFALQSLLSQSYRNFELIVSDNGSTDSTQQICKEFASKDERIRYVRHNENRGAIENFNYVLAQANGKYFMWAAADDYWDEKWVECLLSKMTDSVGSVFGQVKTIDSSGNVIRPYPIGNFSKNTIWRSAQYFLREESLGKANLIYSLWRRDLLPPISLSGNVDEKGAPFGLDMLYVFGIVQSHHVVIVDDVCFYKRQPPFMHYGSGPSLGERLEALLLLRFLAYYVQYIFRARTFVLKLILCLLIFPKYLASMGCNIAAGVANQVRPREAGQENFL